MSEALRQSENVEVFEAHRIRKRTVLIAFVTLAVVWASGLGGSYCTGNYGGRHWYNGHFSKAMGAA